MKIKRSPLDYKWVVLVICFLMEFIALGFCSSNAGIYTKAVTEALHIKRSIFSLSTSIRYVTQIIVSLYFGALVQRFGTKKIVCTGLLVLSGSAVVRACATNVWHFYVGAILWGTGIVFAGGAMAGTIVRRWFHENVGTYLGLVMSANGIGGAVAVQIVTPLINNGEAFGYRKAYMLAAAVSFVIGIVVFLFLREHPAEGPAIQSDGGKKKTKGVLWEGIPYEIVKKKPYFYMTAALVLITGISLQSLGNIGIVYLTDLGFAPGFIATSATVSSLCLTCMKFLVGVAYDKRGLRFTLLACQFCAAAGFVIKALLMNSTLGMVMAIIATVLTVIAAPLETVMLPLITNDLFGSASYNKVLGVMMAMNSLGLCLGTPLGDIYFDFFGTYRPCFWFFAGILLVVAAGYCFVIHAAEKDKKAILAKMPEG